MCYYCFQVQDKYKNCVLHTTLQQHVVNGSSVHRFEGCLTNHSLNYSPTPTFLLWTEGTAFLLMSSVLAGLFLLQFGGYILGPRDFCGRAHATPSLSCATTHDVSSLKYLKKNLCTTVGPWLWTYFPPARGYDQRAVTTSSTYCIATAKVPRLSS